MPQILTKRIRGVQRRPLGSKNTLLYFSATLPEIAEFNKINRNDEYETALID